ncbi:Gfo/Idh/MocA family protein [Streptomyces mirabilis]
MTDKLRAAVVGVGFIGEVHARAVIAAGGVVAGVAASTPERAASAMTRLQAERSSSTAELLVTADDIDVVHICTPNYLHAPLAARALAAGKHVVCEKPLATDADSTRDLVTAADAAGVVAAVPFVYRFYPAVREARARVQRGDTGPLQLLHGSYLQDWLSDTADDNWRVDPALGGASRAFGDIGVHWCDLVEFVTGHRITRVSSQVTTAHARRNVTGPVATEDAAAVLFETDHGALGSVVVSQVSPGRKNRLWFSLDGATESLSFNQELPDSLWVGDRARTTVLARGSADTTPAAMRYSVLPPGHPQGYQDCFNAFVADVYAAIGGETPEGLPTFADGHRAAAVTAAVMASAATHTWMEVRA